MVRRFEYDREQNLTRATDELRDVSFTYAGYRRTHERIEAGTTIRFHYDTEDRLKAIENEHGERYQFELDTRGMVKVERGFDGFARRYERDVAGRVTKVVKASGRTSELSYDAAGRITDVRHSDGTFERYRYRADGTLIGASNDAAEVHFERDALGRVVRETTRRPDGGEHWVRSGYGPDGHRVRVESSDGHLHHIERNLAGDVTRVELEGASWHVDCERDPLGARAIAPLPERRDEPLEPPRGGPTHAALGDVARRGAGQGAPPSRAEPCGRRRHPSRARWRSGYCAGGTLEPMDRDGAASIRAGRAVAGRRARDATHRGACEAVAVSKAAVVKQPQNAVAARHHDAPLLGATIVRCAHPHEGSVECCQLGSQVAQVVEPLGRERRAPRFVRERSGGQDPTTRCALRRRGGRAGRHRPRRRFTTGLPLNGGVRAARRDESHRGGGPEGRREPPCRGAMWTPDVPRHGRSVVDGSIDVELHAMRVPQRSHWEYPRRRVVPTERQRRT